VSIAVALEEIASKLVDYPWCYLVTTGDERSHVMAVRPKVVDDGLRFETGRSSRANVIRNPLVVLTFPSAQPDGMTMLVDGEARVDGDGVIVTPTWAVLHRPAP
jgi:hypothetical protein